MSLKPDSDAGDVGALLVQRGDALEAFLQQLLDVAEVLRDARLRELEDRLLGAVDELRRLRRPVDAQPRNLVAGADEPAQRRHLANDARVVRRVRRGGHERRQLVDPHLSADVLELASLVELVDERDRVDRLAAGVQGEAGAVDLRMALPVEVGCGEDFADRPDCAGGEHHRTEYGLLGIEVLRRNRGGGQRRCYLCHAVLTLRSAPTFNGWKAVQSTAARSAWHTRFAAGTEHLFQPLSTVARTARWTKRAL